MYTIDTIMFWKWFIQYLELTLVIASSSLGRDVAVDDATVALNQRVRLECKFNVDKSSQPHQLKGTYLP